ncbi:Luciferin 4-monooxygenase [Lamellibrachia satsuma]|nr:Luciferin 4-monooxygenase [Lamellibrachia satsuma]
MKGYMNNPTQTASTIDEAGWLHMGDVGFYDTEGYFYIVDRLKEIIKYKGFQVSPTWLERILMSHPLIADAAVVGVTDEEAGQLPRAFVVKKVGGDALTATDVLQYVADRVSPHRQLRGGVVFVASIPKSSTGKILRRILYERLGAGTPETRSKL